MSHSSVWCVSVSVSGRKREGESKKENLFKTRTDHTFIILIYFVFKNDSCVDVCDVFGWIWKQFSP